METQDNFRALVRFYRKNLGNSQSELAIAARISRSTIGNFETKQVNLSSGSMDRVCAALNKLIGDRATAVGFFPASPSALSFRGEVREQV
jgi:transcriptional regulator with XRE-family HTH domain